MANTDERQGHQAIEHQCQVICLTDWLLAQRTIERNDSFRKIVKRIRRHTLEANAATCRALFLDDSLSDLPPAA